MIRYRWPIRNLREELETRVGVVEAELEAGAAAVCQLVKEQILGNLAGGCSAHCKARVEIRPAFPAEMARRAGRARGK